MRVNKKSKMYTIIKWTGGKSKEFPEIEDMVPQFKTYVEPFFGGGAVFFSIMPSEAIINDLSKDLINFYKFVKGDKDRLTFKDELYKYVDNWEKIDKFIKLFENKFNIVNYDFPYIGTPYEDHDNDLKLFVSLCKGKKDAIRKKFPFWGSLINLVARKL